MPTQRYQQVRSHLFLNVVSGLQIGSWVFEEAMHPALYGHQYILCSQLYQVPTVDDEESVPPPRYSMPNGQTYYSGLPTSVPPQALEQTFVSVSDEKERSGQDESKSVGEDSGEEDLEAQVSVDLWYH
jgi:hypothetical protein